MTDSPDVSFRSTKTADAIPRDLTAGTRTSIRAAIDGRLSWLLAGLVVTLLYTSWTLLTLMHASPQDFIHVGKSFVSRSSSSSVISGFTGYRYDGDIGFDGQFMYFIGLDPFNARYYVDYPAYRYTRILYPITAGALGMHDPNLVADALIGLNLLMILLGVCVLGAWLRRRGVSAWLAAVYGFYPGVFVTLQRDTSEVMAYSLAIVAIYLFDVTPRTWLPISAAFFGLAALTRETTLVFAAVWAAGLLLSGEGEIATRVTRNLRQFVVFAAIAFGPLLIWKAFLFVWLGSLGLAGVLSPVPFSGVHYLLRHETEVEQLRTVVVPAFMCMGVAIWMVLAGNRRIEIWSLLLNAVLFMAFLASDSFADISSSGRVTVAICLAAVIAFPYLAQRTRPFFWAAAALWMVPIVFWVLLPVEAGLENLVLRRA